MAKMKTGWKGEKLRHSNARRTGHAGGKYHSLTTKQKAKAMHSIKGDHDIAKTHPREISGMKGLFYMKAGTIHRVSHKRDTGIKANYKRQKTEDSWRGDVKNSRY
jgi:hypothetical protein